MPSKPKRYTVLLKPTAAKALAGLSKKDQRLVAKRISSLEENPRPPGVEKLKGEDNLYRVRCGNYRIIYTIDDGKLTVLVLNIGHRSDVYKRLG